MSQIDITVLKQGNKSNNVISIAFFTMKDSYRPIDFYKERLKTFISRKKALKGFETRIYTDNSGKDIALQVADEDTSVLEYDCPEFREGNGHTGTFGTIVRFLPLFEKDLDVVWISDIDIHSTFLDPNLLTVMQRNNADIFIDNVVCYDRKPWANVEYPIVAHRFISKLKLSRQLLTNFLKRLIDGKYAQLIDELNTFNERKPPNKKFPYGTDEFFLNGPVYNSIKRHTAKAIVRKDYFTQNLLVYNVQGLSDQERSYLREYYYRPTPELFKKIKELYKHYVPMMIEKYPCMQELLDNMPKFKKSFVEVSLINSSDL